MPPALRHSRRIAAAFAVLLALATAAPAAAHSDLHHSEPADGAVLRTAPTSILLAFPVPVQVMTLRLVDQAGKERSLRREGDRTAATSEARATVQGTLPPGDYRIEWRGASPDGHVGGSAVRFRIEPSR